MAAASLVVARSTNVGADRSELALAHPDGRTIQALPQQMQVMPWIAFHGKPQARSMHRLPSVHALCTFLTIACISASSQTAAAPQSGEGNSASKASAGVSPRFKLPLTEKQLLQFNDDFRRPHEAAPEGVPGGYDWYAKPKRGSWNSVPPNHTALTGWGQAFWARGTTSQDAHLLLKNHMTLLCQGKGQWVLVQSSAPVGANFRADFVGNAATRAESPGALETDATSVEVVPGRAYHFWPKAARAAVPKEALCGMLVLVQARAEPISEGGYAQPKLLLGLGADYWKDKTAEWDNYKTNRDVAIGRLKLVSTSWAWYGLSTASDENLERLSTDGYATNR